MSDAFLGDGLIFEDSLPMVWVPGSLLQGPELARLNADNQQLLGAESSLEEARLHEPLKDESAAMVHELQRLEFKLNIVLRLLSDLCLRQNALPAPQRLRLSSGGLEWFAPEAAQTPGSSGVLHLYINPALPQALKLQCTVAGERVANSVRVRQFKFVAISEPVVALIEKLIFRHHRRLIAGSRHTAH
jgi:hypothetical protein